MASTMRVKYAEGVITKLYKEYPENAGYDIGANESKTIKAGSRECIGTGVYCTIPKGYYGRIAPRSGLAAKHGIDVLAGVIDNCYTGEIKVVLLNTGTEDFDVKKGDRIAQLIVTPYTSPELTEVSSLDETDRGDKGFGSSGVA